MKIRTLHSWDMSPVQAVQLQMKLAKRIVRKGQVDNPLLIAGCDVSCDVSNGKLYGVAVLWDRERGCALQNSKSTVPERFPYVPGLLGFREIPALLLALSQLRKAPDAVLVDGQGIAHPRGLGLASHLGLHLAAPTVGCAKSLLVGSHGSLGSRRANWTWLYLEHRRVGAVVRTRDWVRPIYVSPGHRISSQGALRLVLSCLGNYRLPEPLRQAHLIAQQAKRDSALLRGTDHP